MFSQIFLEITNVCNWKCEFCPIGAITRKKGFMDLNLLKDIVGQIYENKLTDVITLHLMGEPLLHKDFDDICRFIKGKGFKISLDTNGSLLTPEKTRFLIDVGIDRMGISFRTPEEGLFKKRGATGLGFEDYKNNIKYLLQLKRERSSPMMVTIRFFDYFLGDGFILPRRFFEYINDKDIKKSIKEFKELFKNNIDEFPAKAKKNKKKKYRLHLGDNVYITKQRIMELWISAYNPKKRTFPGLFGTCDGLTKQIGILWDGEVVTCCKDYDGKNSLGNVKNATLMNILSSKKTRLMKESLFRHRPPTGFCKECMGSAKFIPYIFKQVRGFLQFAKDYR